MADELMSEDEDPAEIAGTILIEVYADGRIILRSDHLNDADVDEVLFSLATGEGETFH
jgi:hypothetical protein